MRQNRRQASGRKSKLDADGHFNLVHIVRRKHAQKVKEPCLLAEFYGLCSMRTFTFAILLPASAALVALAVLDRLKGEGQLLQGMGAVA